MSSEAERLREAIDFALKLNGFDGCYIYSDASRRLNQALAAKPDVCLWTLIDSAHGHYVTACGRTWVAGAEMTPIDVDLEYCPFTGCGAKIEVKE